MPRLAAILNRQAARLRVYLHVTRRAFQIWQKSAPGFAAMEKWSGKAMELALRFLAHFLRNFPSDEE
jgi:hypothetical protein